jgi:PiT family inorganic phosphate transporter
MMAVVTAPVIGFIGGFLLMLILLWVSWRRAPTRMQVIFSRLQWLTTAFLAYSHGKNDGQMPIGVITMSLVIYTGNPDLWEHIPWWIIAISALSISLGTVFGGWRVIRTLGWRVTTLQPIHGFAADFSAAVVIEIASFLGIPVSTTHCVSSAVMGVGATRRLSAVRWGVAGNIVTAWVLTFPICGGLGYLYALVLEALF